jgi:hypothetical protein
LRRADDHSSCPATQVAIRAGRGHAESHRRAEAGGGVVFADWGNFLCKMRGALPKPRAAGRL